jgi:hypothetical protein
MDVLARVQQLMSITETQYSGAGVVIISPDSEVLSVMQVRRRRRRPGRRGAGALGPGAGLCAAGARRLCQACEGAGGDVARAFPQAAVLGTELRRHAQHAFAPGDLRELRLSDRSWDDKPQTITCPDPPRCLQGQLVL